jgi:fumarate hydratase class II
MGGAEGNFELNAFRPVLINNYLHSALIMADMCDHFRRFMVEGAELNQAKLKQNIERSVMMVTALSPIIGYDQASVISHYAIDHDLTLKDAALAKGVSEELFDRVVDPLALTRGARPMCRQAQERAEMGSAEQPGGRTGDSQRDRPDSRRSLLLSWTSVTEASGFAMQANHPAPP